MEENFLICEHCLAPNELQEEVRSRGNKIEKCLICHSEGGLALSVNDQRVRRIFRALVRLNYSEWDYNHHLGGGSLQGLLFGKNAIFNLDETASDLDFEDAFLSLEDAWYPENSEDITLGGGYWDGCILNDLRQPDYEVEKILANSLKSNYFELESEATELINSVKEEIRAVLPIGSIFSRARVGVKERLIPEYIDPPSHRVNYHYLPFSQQEINCPPIQSATEGRLNRARVSILYLASDQKTAISELRPHPGHLVSTSDFKLLRPIKIADFATHDIRDFLSDERLEIYRRILSISGVLNLPIQPEHHALYLCTQLLSDSIRKAGFDGISFRSSLGEGTNLACFAPTAFKQIRGSEAVFEVNCLKYDIVPRNTLPQDYDKSEFKSDSSSTFATLFHGLAKRA